MKKTFLLLILILILTINVTGYTPLSEIEVNTTENEYYLVQGIGSQLIFEQILRDDGEPFLKGDKDKKIFVLSPPTNTGFHNSRVSLQIGKYFFITTPHASPFMLYKFDLEEKTLEKNVSISSYAYIGNMLIGQDENEIVLFSATNNLTVYNVEDLSVNRSVLTNHTQPGDFVIDREEGYIYVVGNSNFIDRYYLNNLTWLDRSEDLGGVNTNCLDQDEEYLYYGWTSRIYKVYKSNLTREGSEATIFACHDLKVYGDKLYTGRTNNQAFQVYNLNLGLITNVLGVSRTFRIEKFNDRIYQLGSITNIGVYNWNTTLSDQKNEEFVYPLVTYDFRIVEIKKSETIIKILGCTYLNATNYDELAEEDDGTCEFEVSFTYDNFIEDIVLGPDYPFKDVSLALYDYPSYDYYTLTFTDSYCNDTITLNSSLNDSYNCFTNVYTLNDSFTITNKFLKEELYTFTINFYNTTNSTNDTFNVKYNLEGEEKEMTLLTIVFILFCLFLVIGLFVPLAHVGTLVLSIFLAVLITATFTGQVAIIMSVTIPVITLVIIAFSVFLASRR